MRKEPNQAELSTVSCWQIAMILLGIAVTPVLIASSDLGGRLALDRAAPVILCASIILTILAVINISIGEKARLPTYGIVKFSFGEQGAIAINILMAISLFGWIAVTANAFGHSMHDLAAHVGINIAVPVWVAFGCVIFVASTAFGLEVLGKVSKIAVPIIAILMVVVLYLVLNKTTQQVSLSEQMSFGAAVSSVVGTIIVLVATSPDFGSFIHNRKHAILAGIIAFGVAYPTLYFVGALPSALTGERSLLQAMAVVGTTVPAAILLVFACITGNAGNMFQGTLVVSTLLSRIAKWKITLALGVLAFIVGSLNIQSWLVPFLLFLGIATPPVAGIYIADFFLKRKAGYDEAVLSQEAKIKYPTFGAWFAASVVGFLTVNGYFTLTGIASLDSILVASLLYVLFNWRNK
ncbi:cytosine permease [Cardiobacteriaceae bacterium TAE3-ERU3]|nr:cytosine permease [Cardiobacteriaceae bacterium TAE3-ERU3]